MKFISWNVNGLRACLKKGFEDVFNALDADFFCIQETKMQPGQADFAPAGYTEYIYSADKKGYSGTAIWAKTPALSVRYGLDEDVHNHEGRAITLEYPDFYLVNLYVPNSQNELARIDYRMQWEDDLRRYLQKQTATTAAGNTAPIVTHAPKLPTISSKQATVEAISRGVHYIAAKIKALLSQTVRHAAQSLLALLGAGGVVLLLAMVIGAAAAVIGSPMGILFADESGDPNSIRIAEIVAETNADFGTAINDIVSAHPECSETTMEYDYEDGHTWASYWPEVLAVFAVQNSLNNDGDVVVIDEGKKQLIQDKIQLALQWQAETGIPVWVGAWMPGDYNDGDNYSIGEQCVFAAYMTESLDEAGIPFAVNSDTKFYDREQQMWYEEMLPLRNILYGR